MSETTLHCRQCQSSFVDSVEDAALREKLEPDIAGKKFSLPAPTLCPDCRQQRRAAHVNEMNLYKRTCDLTGKAIISDKHPDSPYKVFDQEVWYSDKWDPMEYGRPYDFSRSFFEQFKELSLVVPYPNLFTGYQYDENCDYTNYAGKNKNCYLIFDSDENRDCYYSYSLNGCHDCVDCYRMRGSELCYWCIDSYQCYGSSFLQDCVNCTDSMFLKSCIGCKNCLMCVNLQNKQYVIANEQKTKEEFEQAISHLQSLSAIDASATYFERIKLQHPHKEIHGVQNENVSGDYLTSCKNARQCFDSVGLWDCAHIYRAFYPIKDAMDCEAPGGDERLYECSVVGYNAQNIYFSANCLEQCSDLLYCSFCFHCSNCFGCVGLRHKKHCILNRQYSKEEYEELVPKIIEHMKNDGLAMNPTPQERGSGSWGEFFPAQDALFAYNESVASDYYPLTKDEVLARGYRWREKDPKEYQTQSAAIPDDIANMSDDILKEVLACKACGRNYKIIPQELAFYRGLAGGLNRRLTIPNHCFFCRNRNRMRSRNPRKLWERNCMKCEKEIQTSYAPDKPETIYCEECYLQKVH